MLRIVHALLMCPSSFVFKSLFPWCSVHLHHGRRFCDVGRRHQSCCSGRGRSRLRTWFGRKCPVICLWRIFASLYIPNRLGELRLIWELDRVLENCSLRIRGSCAHVPISHSLKEIYFAGYHVNHHGVLLFLLSALRIYFVLGHPGS